MPFVSWICVESAWNAVRRSNDRDRLSHHLSVGEEKRIALATVLSMNPPLDLTRARRTLINRLRELPITMLVSTPEMKLIKELFPRTIVMDDGLVVADGKTKEILANEKFLNGHGLEKP